MGAVTEVTEEALLTIDELAQRTGMTARNIRAHQSRGLLPPPEVRGRTGYYGPEHVARLELIRELQDEGFNLEAIRRLLESAGGAPAEVLRFTKEVRGSFEEEEPEIVTLAQLLEDWGEDADPALLRRAVKLGLLRPLGDDRFEQRSPRLARAGQELARQGVPPERALEVVAALRRHADGVARAFVDLYLDFVWRPFQDAGRPEDKWPEVREALERLRPLAADGLLAMFGLVMTDRVDETFGRELERAVEQPEPGRPRRRRGRSSRRSRVG
jgi:DNA-binding transcriptional MerR regulator